MPWDLLIRGGEIVTHASVKRCDVAIENGKIVALAPELARSALETIDASSLHVFPGVIDAHVHFNEPGRTDWEGFATGSAALAAGGGTCFFDMPLNAHPPTLDGESFDLKLAAALTNSRTDFALWGGLTPTNLDKLEELAQRGVIGFKAFMSNSGIEDFICADDDTLYQGMKTAASLGLPVAVHAEDEAMTARLSSEAIAAGRSTYRDYLNSRPPEAELLAIRNAVAMASETGCALHIVHVSTPQGLLAAGTSGANVSTETCPHYLCFTEADLLATGAALKCAPPVRDRETVDGMIAYLRAGMVSLVGSDHSPAPASMKTNSDAFRVWGGIAGVQSTLSTLLSLEPPVRLSTVAQLTARNVARRFGVADKGEVAIGFDADLALIDLNKTFELRREDLLDRHKLSPYVGRTFHGVVRRTLARGQTIFADGKIVGAHRGRLVQPAKGGPRA